MIFNAQAHASQVTRSSVTITNVKTIFEWGFCRLNCSGWCLLMSFEFTQEMEVEILHRTGDPKNGYLIYDTSFYVLRNLNTN